MAYTERIETARRRYENPEMDAGSVSAATAWTLTLTSLLVILAVPVWRAVGSEPFPVAVLMNGWGDARAAQGVIEANRKILAALDEFEKDLEDSSPLLGASLTKIQWIQLRFGRIGNETVYPGEDGWLLLRTGLDHLVGKPFLDPAVLETRRRSADSWRPEPNPDPRPALLDFHRQLQERGIDLVLLPVPTKPAIESESLAPSALRPLANPSLAAFEDEMASDGIHVFDAASILHDLTGSGTRAYLRTDSHWSPEAVAVVAESLSAWLKETFGDELGPADAFWESKAVRRKGRGDLWHLLELNQSRALFEEESIEANEVTSWDGAFWKPSTDARILVLGDSFVNVYSDENLHWGKAAGFAEQLSLHLERQVDRLARNKSASDQVRKELAQSPERLEGKRVVVYVFASRELSVGDWPSDSILRNATRQSRNQSPKGKES